MTLANFPMMSPAIPSPSGLLPETGANPLVVALPEHEFAALLAALPGPAATPKLVALPEHGRVLPDSLPDMVEIADATEDDAPVISLEAPAIPVAPAEFLAPPEFPATIVLPVASAQPMTPREAATPTGAPRVALPSVPATAMPPPETATPTGAPRAALPSVPATAMSPPETATPTGAPRAALPSVPATAMSPPEDAPLKAPAPQPNTVPIAMPVAILIGAGTVLAKAPPAPPTQVDAATVPEVEPPAKAGWTLPAVIPAASPARLRSQAPIAHAAADAPQQGGRDMPPSFLPPPPQPALSEIAVTIPLSEAHETSPPASSQRPSEAQRPQDFAALVDRLVAARVIASPAPVSMSVAHAEFGHVAVRFERDDQGITVALTSPDPDFARAITAALPAERQAPTGERGAGQTLSQHETASQRDARSGEGTAARQPAMRNAIHPHRPEDRPTLPPQRRSGIFA